MKELAKGGSLTVKDGVAEIEYAVSYDKDQDGRAAAGISAKAFVDIPEVLDEAMKDSATAQVIAKWMDANKMLLPTLEKDI